MLITKDEERILKLIAYHGPSHFLAGSDLGPCHSLYEAGYITDHGSTGAKKLTKSGRSYLRSPNQ